MDCISLILAAGHGTRMKSRLPKVLHRLGGRPLLAWAIETGRAISGAAPWVVVGPQAGEIRQAVGEDVHFVVQEERLGTGHAVAQAASELQGLAAQVLVTSADMPLLSQESLRRMVEEQVAGQAPFSMLVVPDAEATRGFGRIVRGPDGEIRAIVEEAQATPEELAIRELNAGAYCFDAAWLWENLARLELSPKGEYYLTDMVALAVGQDRPPQAVPAADADEAIGINTRQHLAQAEAALRRMINRRWMDAGVTILDPASTYIQPGVIVGQDSVLLPNTHLEGATQIGEGCVVGPHAILRDTILGDGCRVEASVLEGATLEQDVDVGPFSHLRSGAYLCRGVHVGNFGEIKNSRLEPGVKMGHFSYLGDATVGEGTNIGAGTITCNYDGKHKHPTVIGPGVFIGSDTMLVAPVRLGARSRTGAGAVVTRDVPEDTLAAGVPARAIRKFNRDDD